MNTQTEKLLNITTLMLHFVKCHPDCDIDALAKNHLEACKEAGLEFVKDKAFELSEHIPIDLEE